jgi:CHAT domain-containing protein
LGTLYSDAGDHPKALEFYSRALAIRSLTGDQAGAAETLLNMMLDWSDRNPSVGIFYGKHSINLLQQLRAKVSGLDREHQKTFLKSKERTYRILAYMLIGSGRLGEAHQVLNLFKDEQFFDFNSITDREVSLVTLTPGEVLINSKFEASIQRLEAIGQQLDQLRLKVAEQKPGSDMTAERQQLETQLNTALDDFVALVKQTERDFSRMSPAENKVGEITDTRDLQRTLSDLSKQTGQKAIAVYTLLDKELEGEGNGSFCALVISADSITVTVQPVKADAINKTALQLWALLQSDQYDPRPLAQELYSSVFRPIEAAIPKDTGTILWSLDGNLRYLPMGVLYDGKQYLVERFNHVVFTRPDRERLTRRVSARWNGVGLGTSEAHTVEVLGDKITLNALPGVLAELRALFRQKDSPDGVLDGEIMPDAKFTKASMLSALKQKRPVVHISSHFSFRPGDEARSFLLLGDGTAMTLAEMKQQRDLFSGVELLTLSACNTAAQQAGANGREIDGFAELAQRLGAGSVMATLWPVADNSTPWFMREFYKTRENGAGLTKAEAFRRAQLALLKGTAETEPLPAGQKGASSSFVQIVMGGKDAGGRSGNDSTRAGVVYVAEKDAPLFPRDDKNPFAHPYYWAPFILIGNWK